MTCFNCCSREPYEITVEGGGLFTQKLLKVFGGIEAQLLYHGTVQHKPDIHFCMLAHDEMRRQVIGPDHEVYCQ